MGDMAHEIFACADVAKISPLPNILTKNKCTFIALLPPIYFIASAVDVVVQDRVDIIEPSLNELLVSDEHLGDQITFE